MQKDEEGIRVKSVRGKSRRIRNMSENEGKGQYQKEDDDEYE